MRIAQIDVNYQFSSTGKIVADLVTGLAEGGHAATAFFGRGRDEGWERAYKFSSAAEVALHALGTRLTGFTGCYSPLATRQLIRRLAEFNPDVVHLHDLHGYFVNIGELVAYLKCRNTPTVWTFHCEFMYTGKCGHALECDKWRTHCDRCPSLRSYPQSWFFDFTSTMFDQKRRMFDDFDRLHLVAPSAWLANRMRESVIVGAKRIRVIPNGLDTAVFHRRSATRAKLGLGDDFVSLSVGSNLMSKMKGGEWVLELARRIPDMTFVMVGVESIPPSLPANVRMIRRIYDQMEIAEYYSMADVLLLTSAKETFSMVSAESLACGTPVVGFDAGAPKEVAPAGFGQFVPHADVDALEALLRSARHGSLGLKSAAECEAFAQACYSTRAMVSAYEDIYDQVISEAA